MSKLAKYIVGRTTLAMFKHGSPLLLPFPVFLRQIRHHHLQVLVTYSVNPSTVQSLPALRFFLFHTKNNAGTVHLLSF